MKMNTLYAALSGAFLLGSATLVQAQATPAPTTGNPPAGSSVTNPVKNAKVAMSSDYRADKDRIEDVFEAGTTPEQFAHEILTRDTVTP